MKLELSKYGLFIYLKNYSILFHWSSFILVAIFIFGNPLLAISWLILLAAHELGHGFLVRKYRLTVEGITVTPIAAECEYLDEANEWQEIVIAWGGVLAQSIILAIGILMVIFTPELTENVVWGVMVPLNILLILVNLIPIDPLDGKKAWRIIPFLFNKWSQKNRSKAKLNKLNNEGIIKVEFMKKN